MTKAKKWADIQQVEATLNDTIPFEIHVTVNLIANDTVNFVESCRQIEVKPIVLALQRQGENLTDVMTSSVHMGTNRSAYDEMKRISDELTRQGYNVVREKIETVPWHPASPSIKHISTVMPKDCYFETHIGVNVQNDLGLSAARLEQLVIAAGAHLSRNAFKIHDDNTYTQMVTHRVYDDTLENFELEADALYANIIALGYEVEKRVTEFSIYDTKISHDSAWLTNDTA